MLSNKPGILNRWKWMRTIISSFTMGRPQEKLSPLRSLTSAPTALTQQIIHTVSQHTAEYTQEKNRMHVHTVHTKATRSLTSKSTFVYIRVKSHSPALTAPISPTAAAIWTATSVHTSAEELRQDWLKVTTPVNWRLAYVRVRHHSQGTPTKQLKALLIALEAFIFSAWFQQWSYVTNINLVFTVIVKNGKAFFTQM